MIFKNSRTRPQWLSGWQWAWAIVASLFWLPLAFWGIAWDEVTRYLWLADWRAVGLAMTLFVLTTIAKTIRWRFFFPARAVKWSSLFAALAIGQAVNFMLPMRVGDVARIYVLRRREGERAARVLGTLGAEKLIELIALVLLAAAVAPFMPWPNWLRDPSLRLSAFGLALILLLSLIFLQQARLRQIAAWVAARLGFVRTERAEQQFDLTLEGFAPLRQRQPLILIVLWSLLVWALMIATNYALFWALPLERSWLAATMLLLVLQVGVAVPSTPGKIGVFQYLASLTLLLFGVSRELALGYGLLLYLVVLAPQVGMALPFVWQEA